jgi:hypothetical protein
LGWSLTPVPTANAASPPQPSNSASTASPSPTATPSGTQTAESTEPNGGFKIPDYAALGTPFTAARNELRSHKLGVDLVFGQSGPPQVVNRTSPVAGRTVTAGLTVRVFVNGPPPPLAVPPIVPGTSCQDWASQLVSQGFKIARYKGGNRSKPVTAESPDETDPTTTWNTAITLTCGDDQQGPTGSPSTSGPGGPPSPSPSNTP